MPYDNDVIPVMKTLPLEEHIEDDDAFEEQPFSIRDRFSAEKGDLVYGLSGEMGNYLSSAIGQTFRPEDKQMPASIIDMYNNTISLQTNQGVTLRATEQPVNTRSAAGKASLSRYNAQRHRREKHSRLISERSLASTLCLQWIMFAVT